MITKLSAATLRHAADIRDKITGLENELSRIFGGERITRNKPAPAKRRCMSPEARAKIAIAARRRWRIAKRAGRKTL